MKQLKTQDPNAWGLFNASLPIVYFLWGSIPLAVFTQIVTALAQNPSTASLAGILALLLMGYRTVWSYAVFNVTERRDTDFWMIIAMIVTGISFTVNWIEFIKGLLG